QPVARKKERLAITVPEREGEHAAEALDATLAPRLPGMHDHLGVALRAEDVAEGNQFRNERLEVVELAVEYHHHRAVLVVERLLAGREVDDGEAPVAEANAGLEVQAAGVGA